MVVGPAAVEVIRVLVIVEVVVVAVVGDVAVVVVVLVTSFTVVWVLVLVEIRLSEDLRTSKSSKVTNVSTEESSVFSTVFSLEFTSDA